MTGHAQSEGEFMLGATKPSAGQQNKEEAMSADPAQGVRVCSSLPGAEERDELAPVHRLLE